MLISFTGKKGHGKSTACNKIVEMYGDRVVRVNFKDALISSMKDKVGDVLIDLSVHYNMTEDELFNEKPPIMRRLMQFVGTDVYREINQNFWVDAWVESVSKYINSDKIILTDDVRFTNEFDAVIKLGGTVTKIVAVNKPISNDTHPSELEMESFVCPIIEAISKEDLEEKVAKTFK